MFSAADFEMEYVNACAIELIIDKKKLSNNNGGKRSWWLVANLGLVNRQSSTDRRILIGES